MEIIVTKDYQEMSYKAAELVANQIKTDNGTVLGLATGSTPAGMYHELIRMHVEKKLNFINTSAFNMDEYVGLPETHKQSFHYYLEQNFFRHINIKKENTYVPNGQAEDMIAENKRYLGAITSLGGIDIQVLGIGLNGHIGFNEPGEYFSKGLVCTELTDSTIAANARFFRSQDEVPKKALTLGIRPIMQAKKIILMASGHEKAPIMEKALFGNITPEVPASVLQLHRNLTVIIDDEAYAMIKDR